MRRVLVIAYYFPPIGGIGSIRMGRFAELLPEFGWEPTVIAPGRTPHELDPELNRLEGRVIRAPSIELSRLGSALPTARSANPRAAEATGRSLRTGLRTAAHRFVFFPDAQIGWYPGALLAGARALRNDSFDAIYSSSNPITAHLVARTLCGRARLPWVAEFRDPWSDRLPADHPYRRRAAALIQNLGASATRVIVPTPTLVSYYEQRWGRQVDLVQNGHDLDQPIAAPPERPTVTHVGSYYPGRQSFLALWRALAVMVAEGRDPPLVRFVGELPQEISEQLREFGLEHLVEATGFVPHAEAMRMMLSSSMLIASGFAGTGPTSRGVIPAKLFEYLASGLPILYLGHRADDAALILAEQPGCYVIDSDDVVGVAAALREGLAGGRHDRSVSAMSRRARTAELAAILDRAVTHN